MLHLPPSIVSVSTTEILGWLSMALRYKGMGMPSASEYLFC